MGKHDFRDKLFIEDLPKLDNEMLEDAVKNAKVYNFRGVNKDSVLAEAVMCFFSNIIKALENLGIVLPKNVFHVIMKSPQSEFNDDIEMENRTKYRNEESYRNGTYIFKKGELAYFIGAPDLQKQSVLDYRTHYTVRANVRL